jgi:LysR substrate binding domain
MAKHLALMENNPRGHAYRQWLIDVARVWSLVPQIRGINPGAAETVNRSSPTSRSTWRSTLRWWRTTRDARVSPALIDVAVSSLDQLNALWQHSGASRKAGFEPVIGQPAPQIAFVVILVAAELGVLIVPASMAKLKLTGVTYRPIAGRAPTTRLTLAHRRGETSPVVRTSLRERCPEVWPGCTAHAQCGPYPFLSRRLLSVVIVASAGAAIRR